MEIQELVQHALTLRDNGRGQEAAEAYLEAGALYAKEGKSAEAIECRHMAAVSYKVANDSENALPLLGQVAAYYEENNDVINEGRVRRDIGLAYIDRKEYAPALAALEQSEKLLNGTAALAELGITQAKIGALYLAQKDLAQAEEWIYRGLHSIRQEDSWFYEMTTLLHAGSLEIVRENWNEAANLLWAGVGCLFYGHQENGQKRRLAQFCGGLTHAYLGLGNMKTAHRLFAETVMLLEDMSEESATLVKEDIDFASLAARLQS